ncbi:MAG: hypothetical protein IT319_18825 [Anaerolineae bacterium]|nr:hypothetical protein [Anaerolineae bacterium]
MDSETNRFFAWIDDTESDEPRNGIEEFLLRLSKVLTNLATAVAVAALIGTIFYGVASSFLDINATIIYALAGLTLLVSNRLLPIVRFARRYQLITFIGLIGIVRALLTNVSLISQVASTGSPDLIVKLIVSFLTALFLGESPTSIQ